MRLSTKLTHFLDNTQQNGQMFSKTLSDVVIHGFDVYSIANDIGLNIKEKGRTFNNLLSLKAFYGLVSRAQKWVQEKHKSTL